MSNETVVVPPRGPGHCDDDKAWAEFVRQYDGEPRSRPDMTDFALANRVFMADRGDIDLIVWQTAAKERIRWLSIELAKALAAAPQQPAGDDLRERVARIVGAGMVSARDPIHGGGFSVWVPPFLKGTREVFEEEEAAVAALDTIRTDAILSLIQPTPPALGEDGAWQWLSGLCSPGDPADHDYSADEMVDAHMAGQSAALQARPASGGGPTMTDPMELVGRLAIIEASNSTKPRERRPGR